MDDKSCVQFLQWALPLLHLRWKGFKKVRRQVCRRLKKRLNEINPSNLMQYREYLELNPDEWKVLDRLCRITISRFYRDRSIFDHLVSVVFPALISTVRSQGNQTLKVWSCGCASGEEPYTVAIIWHNMFRQHHPDLRFEIIATDMDPVMIDRAKKACYPISSLGDVPAEWRDKAFVLHGDLYSLKEEARKYVQFKQLDVREGAPGKGFHMVLCRYLAFTYFAADVQAGVLQIISDAMLKRGALVVGAHEVIPNDGSSFASWVDHKQIYMKE